MVDKIIVIVILTVLYITCSFPVLLIILFVIGMLVALNELLKFKKYDNTRKVSTLTKNVEKYKSFETVPSVEEIMKWIKIGLANKEKKEREKRGE